MGKSRTIEFNAVVESLTASVRVEQHQPDWNDLEEGTRQRMFQAIASQTTRCFYLNPLYTVSASEPTRQFFQKARTCQQEWCRRFTRQLGPRARRGLRNRVPLCSWEHLYTGFLIIDGKRLRPWEWSARETSPRNAFNANQAPPMLAQLRKLLKDAKFECPPLSNEMSVETYVSTIIPVNQPGKENCVAR